MSSMAWRMPSRRWLVRSVYMPMSLAATSESVDEYNRAPSAMSRARSLLVLVSVPL